MRGLKILNKGKTAKKLKMDYGMPKNLILDFRKELGDVECTVASRTSNLARSDSKHNLVSGPISLKWV